MRSKIQFALWFCLGSVLAATGCTGEKKSASSDMESLQGMWHLVYQEINGKKLPDEKMAEAFHGKMIFVGEKIRYTAELQGFDFQFDYKLDPDRHPKEIDLRLTDTVDKPPMGQALFGIYRLDGSTLEICYSKRKRPVDFAATEGSNITLIVLKRKSAANAQ